MTLEYKYAYENNPLKEIAIKRTSLDSIIIRRSVVGRYGETLGIIFKRESEPYNLHYFLKDDELDEFIKALQEIKARGAL
jgi:hypothetical protein